jgi:hypothetical protein
MCVLIFVFIVIVHVCFFCAFCFRSPDAPEADLMQSDTPLRKLIVDTIQVVCVFIYTFVQSGAGFSSSDFFFCCC